MSRSFRKAFYTISKRMSENVHKRVRMRIKRVLKTININEPQDNDQLISTADTKELGLEEWGTKWGLEFDCDAKWKGEQDKARRK